MNATLPLNRVGAHFDSASAPKLALPQGERARGQLWSDAVFEAVQALRIQLHSRSEPIAAAAANSILELERTRMRHDKLISGTDKSVVPSIPVAGLALILGIDRFMSEARALTNLIGNGVATVVVARWEGDLDRQRMAEELR